MDINSTISGAGETTKILNGGISQIFDYGVGMSALGLFLAASLLLNIFLLRFLVKHMKDSLKVISDIYALARVLNESLDQNQRGYDQIIVALSKLEKRK